MPPSASSNKPFLFWCAPVKAPLTWPNSSLSSRFSGSAPQLMGMNDLIFALGVLVNRARDEFFAGARFALNQNRGIGRRDALRPFPALRCIGSEQATMLPESNFCLRLPSASARLPV